MTQWIEDPQGRLEVEKVTKEMKLPVWKANHKGKFRDFWNELWDKIEDYVVKLKGDTEKKSEGLNDRLVSAVGKHDGDFPISNAVVGNVYYSELTKKYYKCKVGGPAPMPNGNFIDLSILENLNRLENLISFRTVTSTAGMSNVSNCTSYITTIGSFTVCSMNISVITDYVKTIIKSPVPFKTGVFITIEDNNEGLYSTNKQPVISWYNEATQTCEVANINAGFTMLMIGIV